MLAGAVVQALGVVLVLQLAHLGGHEPGEPGFLTHWLRDAALTLPLAAVAVVAATVLVERLLGAARAPDAPSADTGARLLWVQAASLLFAALSVPAGQASGWLAGASGHGHGALRHAAVEAATAHGASVVALGGLIAVVAALTRRGGLPRVRASRRAGALASAALTLPGLIGATALATLGGASPASAAETCRVYDVAAINVDIPYNRWEHVEDGVRHRDIDFDGMAYVLQEDKKAVKNWHVPLGADAGSDPAGAGNRRLRPRPLVLRANAGECVTVNFTNELNTKQFGGRLANPRASMKVYGAAYDVQTSDGSAVGFNTDTTIGIGQSITYTWRAPEEGLYGFRDQGMPAGSQADGGSAVHGLFGALAVEPAGSTWTDPVTGARLDAFPKPYQDPKTRQQSGELYIDAIIAPPGGKQFRESVQLSQDEIPGIGFGFNYGAEPGDRREQNRCPDCIGEETSLSSWTYGDPALVKLASGLGPWLPRKAGETFVDPEDCGIPSGCWVGNVTHAYRWDATKIRYGHSTAKETHVFHMHAHQWLQEPKDAGTSDGNPTDTNPPESMTVDSQTYGPGDMFTADLLWGAGSQPGTVGDSIFHCHLYPHFAEGFWSLFRVHDVREDGSGRTPDGIKVRNLIPLTSNTKFTPPAATDDNPGFPRFIPGQFGWRAPQPYGGVTQGGVDATRIVAGRPLSAELRSPVQRVTPQVTSGTAAVDEVQTVTYTPTAGATETGTFTLTSDGAAKTAGLAPDADAVTVQAALRTLPGLETVTVTKDPAAAVWTVTFPGLGNVPQLVADGASLTGGTVAVATTTEGAAATSGGGSFTLTFAGATTPSLPAGAPAADVAAALEALLPAGQLDVDVATDAATGAFDVTLLRWPTSLTSLALTATGATVSPPAGVDLGDPETVRIANQLVLERTVLLAANGGQEPKRGAPMYDPCKNAKREVTYDVSVIQRDVVYNEAGWHDTQGRLIVLDKDVDAVLAGTKEPEPLFARVQSGDCINFNLTNRLPTFFGADAFVKLAQANMVSQHIHLVKFDVLGSDGSSNGWNYQQAAFTGQQVAFNQRVLDGSQACTTTGTDPCRIPMSAGATYSPTSYQPEDGQKIHARWFADYQLRTVFSHDHHFPALDQNRGLFGALLVEPAGTEFRNPFTGTIYTPSSSKCGAGAKCVGDAVGPFMDIIGPGAKDDFREYGLAFQDFVELTKAGGDPANPADTFNPPAEPEAFPDEDPGVMGINYRNAPFKLRDTKGGAWVDPAYRFSSTVFGDPKTPLLQAYAGDEVRMRLIGGSQEEQHIFAMHGMRWRDEPADPQSPIVNQRALGVSDALNFEVPYMDCGVDDDCRGDYLYSSTSTDATYLGMWGLMRVYGRGVDGLLPLPDNKPQAVNGTTKFAVTGAPPPKANKPGTPCASADPVKQFHVVATDGKITYNKAGDHDPYGLMYGLVRPGETVEQAVSRVRANPQPLVIRANEDDCLEVTLTNAIDPAGKFAVEHAPKGAAAHPQGGDPSLPLEGPAGTKAGLRVSLHPQVLKYDVRGSDGATIGFNRDQTVAPGESILYRWSANDTVFETNTPGEIGATNLVDFGDLRGHRHHGLFAGLNIEPKGSAYHDPFTGAEVTDAVSADIRVPGRPDFREFTTFFSDGMNLKDASGAAILSPIHDGEPMDSEDEGEKGFNYASEPFRHRLGGEPTFATTTSPTDGQALARVFSSEEHGDPATPIFRAYAGDPVRMRVLQGSDKPRQHVFQQNGHAWIAQPHDPDSTLVGAQGGISVSKNLSLHLPKAGGPGAVPGDYKYHCGVAFHHESGGLWGIMRVYPKPADTASFSPSPIPAVDDPRAPGNAPLQHLERSTVTADVFDDGNSNRTKENDERVLPGVTVKLTQRAPGADGQLYTADDVVTVLDDRGRTGADGRVTYSVAPGVYDLDAVVPLDWAETTPTSVRTDVSTPGSRAGATFGQVQLGDVTVRAYNDKDGSQVPGTGEKALSGWTVTLTGGGQTRTATSDTNGLATFDGLRPGSYTANATAQPGWFNTRPMPVEVTLAENESGKAELGYALKSGLSVKLFNDSNGDGTQGTGESSLADWDVKAVGGPTGVTVTATGKTDVNGVVTLDDPDPAITGLRPGAYTITRTAPNKDWTFGSAKAATTSPDGTATTPGFSCDATTGACSTLLVDDTTQVVTIGNRNPNVWVVASPYLDANANAKRDGGEGRLAGEPWKASLYLYDVNTKERTAVTPAGSSSNTLTIGSNGLGVFYPLPVLTDPAKRYQVEMLAPPKNPDPAILDYTATSPTTVLTSPIAGEAGRTPHGFAQLGTVGVTVFADHDRDKLYDDPYGNPLFDELPLANRTVELYDKAGKTLIAKGVTDNSGRFSFKVTAGTEHQIAVLLPAGFTQTTPLTTSGTPATKVKVAGPSGTTSVDVQWGHYSQSDVTPPPPPAATPAGGTYSTAQTVALASETGAVIRYTLDGSAPTATSQKYVDPVNISTTTTLKAIAYDAAGNASTVTTESYTMESSPSTDVLTAAASSWTATKGSVTSGSASNLGANDGSYLLHRSVKSGKNTVVDGYGAYTVPEGKRNLTALKTTYDGGAGTTSTKISRTLSLFNWSTNSWESLATESQTAADKTAIHQPSGDVKRFLSSTGEIRYRVEATDSAGTVFDLKADQLAFEFTHQL